MKKKALTLILSALIGLTMLVMPIYADDSYSFTYVKWDRWMCNGIQYKIGWKGNHYRVYKYDPQTSKAVSSVPIGPKMSSTDDRTAVVSTTRSETGLVYITVEKYYQDYLYCYDQKTDKAFLAQKGAGIISSGGGSFMASSFETTDLSPVDLTLYRFTDNGCEKIRKLSNRAADAIYSKGSFYYMTYPDADRVSYGVKIPDMHKLKIYKINPDGSGKTLLKTVTGKHKSDVLTDQKFTAHKAVLWLNQKKITVRY